MIPTAARRYTVHTMPTRRRTKLALAAALFFLGMLFLILMNSSLGVDREETLTDLRRVEIVGEEQSNRR